jgi:hypothetical protein
MPLRISARTWTAGIALAAGIALLPGCGSSNDSSSDTSSHSAAAAPTSAAAPAPSSAPASDASDASDAGGKICSFLSQAQGQVEAAKSPGDAKAVLAISVATFASQNADLREQISSQLDALTRQTCPDTRSALLKKTGANTLTEAVSQT